METKDRNRGAGNSRPRQGATRTSRNGKAAGTGKQTPEARRQATQQAQRRRAAEQRKAAEQEQLWAQQHQEAVQARQTVQTQSLPDEEVHRPTPSQDRHAAQEQPVRRRSAAKGTGQGRQPAAGAKPAARKQTEPEQERKAPTQRRVSKPRVSNAPAVIYTQPAPFNLNRLLIQLLTVTAVVLALTLCLSIFFKVEVITVSGAETYSEWAVREASGIQEGDSLLTFSRARAGARIRAELPYVDEVRFGIKLPNTVIIDIVELDVVYAIQSTDGMWWLITSEGRVVSQTDKATAAGYTEIIGIEIVEPEVNKMAVPESDPITDATAPTDASGSAQPTEDPLGTVPVIVTNAQRLATVLEILQALEDNDIVGEVASVDVSNLSDIILWYGNRYQVEMGDSGRIGEKIAAMQDVVMQLSDYEMGVLDVSFTLWQDKVEFAPFED